tara:strand:- start:1154 stop:3097 length:1944 start_codon:yes stop_codon:yes gene_type:complete
MDELVEMDKLALSTPLHLGGKVARNRIVAGPMCVMLSNADGSVSQDVIDHYRIRARGGAGMVIVEITFTDDYGSRAFHAQLGANNDKMIPGLNQLAEVIKVEGAIAGIQLGHCGAQRVITESPIVAPSPIPWMEGKRVPHELTLEEVKQVILDFVDAAGRASDAGFDLVELHGAHGYLINAFLSPPLNQRKDCYGGSPENRLRMAKELVERIRDRISTDCLLGIRLNGDDQLDGGLVIEEYIDIAKELSRVGIDIFHVSAGTYRVMEQRITPMYLPEGPFIKYAEKFKEQLDSPIIASGSIHNLETCNSIISDGMADMVSLARPLFADPELPNKLFRGDKKTIVPCIRCNTCVAREQSGARGHCAVNPVAGREKEEIHKSNTLRTIAVIGAGPAGIQFSLGASKRGHRVILLEKEKQLGGQIALAEKLSFKEPFRRLLKYYSGALNRADVDVRLGTRLDEQSMNLLDHVDIIIFAMGSTISVPQAFQRPSRPTLSVFEALSQPGTLGTKVVIIGANLVGAETAWHLAKIGHDVTLVERSNGFANDINLISRLVLPKTLSESGVSLLMGAEALSASAGGLIVRSSNNEKEISADNIVVAFGARPNETPLSIEELCRIREIDVHYIQQQHKIYPLYWATHCAHQLARIL